MGILRVLEGFMREDGWPVQSCDLPNVLLSGIKTPRGSWACIAIACKETESVVFDVVCAHQVATGRRGTVRALFSQLNRSNDGVRFSIYSEQGDMRVRSTVPLSGVSHPNEALREGLYRAVSAMNAHALQIKAATGELSHDEAEPWELSRAEDPSVAGEYLRKGRSLAARGRDEDALFFFDEAIALGAWAAKAEREQVLGRMMSRARLSTSNDS